MPSVTVTPASGSGATLGDVIDFIDWATTEAEVGTHSSTSFELLGFFGGEEAVATVRGSGFTYNSSGLTGGTIKSVSFEVGGVFQGTITGSLPAADIASAIRQEDLGTNIFALEDYFMGLDWTYNGTSAADFAPAGMEVGDGASFNLRGNDILRMGGGNDVIFAGDGNDLIDGGTGTDTMAGGRGNDTYVVNTSADRVIEANGQGTDKVNSSTSFSLAGQYVENLTLTGSAHTSGIGNSLKNTLVGNAGNNGLNGGTGADRMEGKAGNDTYSVDNAADTVIEASGQGTDKVNSSVTFSLAGQQVENLTLTGSASINGTGNSLKNVLIGNAGNNVLNGSTGADRMEGKAGNDIYSVDNAADKVIEASGQGTDKVNSATTFSLAGQSIENLTLTGSADISGTGNGLNNTLLGNAGNNVLNGGAGGDTLTGSLGADHFFFSNALGSTNVDSITDYSVASDTIRLEDSIFTAIGAPGTLAAGVLRIGAAAADASDRIIYDPSTGALLYDADGSGAGAAVQFATLDDGLALTRSDFLIV